jgi:hypothetical protein
MGETTKTPVLVSENFTKQEVEDEEIGVSTMFQGELKDSDHFESRYHERGAPSDDILHTKKNSLQVRAHVKLARIFELYFCVTSQVHL